MTKVRRPERLARVALGLALLYSVFLIRDVANRARERPSLETFPFFMWELFSTVPEAHQSEFALRLTEMDGAAVAGEGVYFEESLLPDHQNSGVRGAVSRMGAALEQGRVEDFERDRTLLETRYLYPLTSAKYQLVKREYDVEERYECGCFTSELVVAEFEMTEK